MEKGYADKTGNNPKMPILQFEILAWKFILSNYSNKPREDKNQVFWVIMCHQEIFFPYWENESPGGDI